MARKWRREPEELEDLAREERRLVRADRHRDAERGEIARASPRRPSRIFDSLAADLVVARLERLLHAARHVVGVERALQQLVQAVADEIA